MKRNLVQIARIRMEEVVPGDVVNRVPDDTRGWFVVAALEPLFDGTLQVTNASRSHAFSAGPLDIVGVQLLKPIELAVTEEPGQLLDALGGTHDTTIDSAAARDGDAATTAETTTASAAVPGGPGSAGDPRLPVPHALTAPAPQTVQPTAPEPEARPQPVERPVERRTMRSLVDP